jgi:hypothetical protein
MLEILLVDFSAMVQRVLVSLSTIDRVVHVYGALIRIYVQSLLHFELAFVEV